MAVFTKTFVQDLKSCLEPHITDGLMFSADNESNIINVELYDGGTPATVTGNVVVYAIREDENTVVFSGTLTGNVASATLPQSCFSAPGPLAVLIQIVSGDVKTTVLKAVFTVVASTSGAIIDPGHEIPDIADIIAMLDELEQAVASLETTVAAAEANALKAEGYAVGTQDGTAVTSGSPYYEDNAKYYAEKAETLAHASTIVKTVSNTNPITIDDGADDTPVRQLLVNILPTQAGEGDPSPTNIRAISGHVSVEVTINGTAYGQFFPAAAGTVYAGTLDALTGVLTVCYAIETLTSEKTVSYGAPRFYFALGSVPRKAGGVTMFCSHYKSVYPRTTAAFDNYDYAITLSNSVLSSSNGRCFLRDSRYTTVADLKAYWDAQNLAGTPVQVVYPIATPQTYQLTPQVVKTLLGNNSFGVDCGTLDLTYVADLQTYVDDEIAAATAVKDVQVDGTSILSDGVANIEKATAAQVQAGTETGKILVPSVQDASAFFGLAKAAGDSTQSASSNAVGTYTDAAKVAIQKMLGIYQAPWELIRTDIATNATEADIEITVDGNGQAFELTDVRILFWLPVQQTAASKGDYGRIYMYYNASQADTIYCGAWSQSAGGSSKICGGEALQNGNMIELTVFKNVSLSGEAYIVGTLRAYPYSDNNSQHWSLLDSKRIYSKVVITKVTGTYGYVLFGKRKWN